MDSSRLHPSHDLDHCPVKPRVDCNHWKCVCNRMSCVTFEGGGESPWLQRQRSRDLGAGSSMCSQESTSTVL